MNPVYDACPAALRVIGRIKAEHLALARIIAAMQAWVARARGPGRADAPLFASMLKYVEEVPDSFHHPQEDRHLFPALAGIAEAAPVVAGLEREHAEGARRLAAVRGGHDALAAGEPNALNRLATAVDEFAEFYWNHMRTEEEVLLPIAARTLSETEWLRIDGAFEVVNDPLFTSEPATRYRELYRAIAAGTPGPLRGFVEEAARPAPR